MRARVLTPALLVLAAGVTAGWTFSSPGPGPTAPKAAAVHYRVVHGWPQLPEGRDLGEVAGVGVDPQGNVFVFHRNEREWPASDSLSTDPIALPTVTEFDGRTGKILSEWGANTFALPHGLTVDAHGNVWLTDVALQQVFEYSHDGRLLMTLGVRGVAGNDSAHFDRPTKVAVAPDGSFYVSDGYRNTRVIKFSPEGKFLFQWGTPGTGPGQFDLPHSVTLDSVRPGLRFGPQQRARAGLHPRWTIPGPVEERRHRATLRRRDRGGRHGVHRRRRATSRRRRPIARASRSSVRTGPSGSGSASWGNYDGQFEIAHDIAVGPGGAIYVGDVTGKRIQKFVPASP